ncbi:MAG: hypothetical protein ACYTKC_07070 [Planctomycetota bacterium]|jgi:tetratricopeptide (TPR) repeat protein
MSTRYVSCSLALALALPLAAQERVVEANAKAQQVANIFYRAFYLEKGEQRHQEAIDLYKKFLGAAPNNRYSGKAADSLVKLLNRVGKVEEAQKARQQYREVLAKLPPEQRGRDDRGGRGGQRGRGDRGGQRGRGDRGGQRGRGGFGGRRGGFGGARTPIPEMTEEELDRFVDQTNRMAEFMIARMEDRGQEEEAKKLEKQIDNVIKLIDDGKKQEAQKAYEALRETMFTRGRRGGRGGERGGRGGFGGRGRLRMPEGLEAPLAQMDDETRQKKVNYVIEWAKNQTQRMRGEQAEKLTGQIGDFKKLVEKKEWKAADALIEKVMQALSGGGNRGEDRRRRGGERGGEGRRREGGGTGRIK